MFGFIDVLKALATILITNSHYGNIWPISAMAMGGLLGNVIFFAVSGFCLCNIKLPFHKWYLKRIVRIYPLLWIVNIVGLIIGYFGVSDMNDVWKLFVFPTYYHFIASIMFLYIIYYWIIWLYKKYQMNLKYIIFGVIGIHVLIYLTVYDRSYYHIDVVEEPMIRFLYLEAMLMGVYFKENIQELKKKNIIGLILMIPVYFGSKVIFSRIAALSQFQLLNQFALLLLLYYLFQTLCVCEQDIKDKLDSKVGQLIRRLANLTIEIYLVQYLVYYIMPEMVFPVNFVITTSAILLFAFGMNLVGNSIRRKCG